MAYILVIVAGLSVALQQVLNADLRTALGSPWWAGFFSYLGGILVFGVLLVASNAPRLTADSVARAPWISWAGGLFGAAFIGISVVMIPRLGAATTLALIVAGQMLGALLFDQVGLLSLNQHPVTPLRLLGVVCLVAGVLLIRS
jgi:transporter family-2 protein